MKKLFFILALSLFMVSPVYANHMQGHVAVHNIIVRVNGLVCDFCARSLEKVFYKEEGVEGVRVDLDKKTVSLGLSGTAALSDEKIKKLITDAGYNVVDIVREN